MDLGLHICSIYAYWLRHISCKITGKSSVCPSACSGCQERNDRSHPDDRWIPLSKATTTVYPKEYAHGFCFAVLCCGYTLTDFPISIRLTSLALWQSNDCPSASKANLMNMDKYFMWIHYERLRNHNKAKHNKTVCIFLGIYCTRIVSMICRYDEVSMSLSKLQILQCSWMLRAWRRHQTRRRNRHDIHQEVPWGSPKAMHECWQPCQYYFVMNCDLFSASQELSTSWNVMLFYWTPGF